MKKDALKFGLALLLILIMALICKVNEKQFLSTKIMDVSHCEIDSITDIKLKNPIITAFIIYLLVFIRISFTSNRISVFNISIIADFMFIYQASFEIYHG